MTTDDLLASLTEEEIRFISSRDYGADSDRHYAALNNVLARGGRIRAKDEYWFPYEAIELGKNALEPGHDREFAACIVIVLENILSGDDTWNDADYILETQKDAIDSLPSDLRNLIFSLANRIRIEVGEQTNMGRIITVIRASGSFDECLDFFDRQSKLKP
jgi:hypothetical protein